MLLNKNFKKNRKMTIKKHDKDDKEDNHDNNNEDNHNDCTDDYDLKKYCSYEYQMVNKIEWERYFKKKSLNLRSIKNRIKEEC